MASDKAYNKIESIVMERVFSLENENAQLRNDLAVAQAKLEKKQAKQQKIVEQKRIMAANPNEVIGKAFHSTGTICMSIGIPSLVTGAILLGVGNTKVEGTNEEDIKKIKSYAKCAAAGYVLLPMGASLTIVGVPLFVHGKRIAELNFNYTGNGAGISMNF